MILNILYIVNLLSIIFVVCFQRKDPVVSIAWVLCFIAFPGFGLVIYLIFGIGLKRHTKKKYMDMVKKNNVCYILSVQKNT